MGFAGTGDHDETAGVLRASHGICWIYRPGHGDVDAHDPFLGIEAPFEGG
jgi:hypothetical protein